MTGSLLTLVIAILAVFGLGYALGRRVGAKQGHQLGLAQARIDLRISALEHGRCPICRHRSAAVKKADDEGLDYHCRREY